jgi:hypothetical protein
MSTKTPNPSGKLRRALLIRWLALWPITLFLWLYPVSNRLLRATWVALCVLLFAGALLLAWQVKWARMILLGIPVLLGVILVLPGHPVDCFALRAEYVKSLRGFEGCRYVWGGENQLGIDCSGLVRAGLVHASLGESARTLNPTLTRSAIALWWHDATARALGEGHRRQTACLFASSSINAIDLTQLRPGDLAVTDDGIHVLAYLGGGQWIEADPDAKHVLVVTVPSTNVWFAKPVNLVRWRMLDDSLQAVSQR